MAIFPTPLFSCCLVIPRQTCLMQLLEIHLQYLHICTFTELVAAMKRSHKYAIQQMLIFGISSTEKRVNILLFFCF